jgi:hypothetical protein
MRSAPPRVESTRVTESVALRRVRREGRRLKLPKTESNPLGNCILRGAESLAANDDGVSTKRLTAGVAAGKRWLADAAFA